MSEKWRRERGSILYIKGVIKLYSVWHGLGSYPSLKRLKGRGTVALLAMPGRTCIYKNTCAMCNTEAAAVFMMFSGRLLLCSSFPNQRSLSTQCGLG